MSLEDYEDIDDMEMSLADIEPPLKSAVVNNSSSSTTKSSPLSDKYIMIYPCYFDKNRTTKQGRRLNKKHCMDNPLGMIVAATCHMLHYDMKYEPDKVHPQDFLNPGRVKIRKLQNGKNKDSILLEISKNMPRSTEVVVQSLTHTDIIKIDSDIINKQYSGIKNNNIKFLPYNSPLSEMTPGKVQELTRTFKEITMKKESEVTTSKTLQKKIKKGNKIKMIRR